MKSVFSFKLIADSWRKNAQHFSASGRATLLKTNNRKLQTHHQGYSLVEVLVAITVLLIALVGPLTIAHSGLKRSYLSREQTQAVFLAQEGTEALVKLREDAALAAASYSSPGVWSSVELLDGRCAIGSSNYCGVVIVDSGAITPSSFYVCNATNCAMKYQSTARVPFKQANSVAGVDTLFTRQMQIDVEDSHARVISIVTWGSGTAQRVELETYVYNIYYAPE